MAKQGAILVQRAKVDNINCGLKFERIPENTADYNTHILYNFPVKQVDENNALIGWCNTGYIGEFLPSYQKPIGIAYAPLGFSDGEMVFIKSTDPNLKLFLENFDSKLAKKTKGRYSMTGFLIGDGIR